MWWSLDPLDPRPLFASSRLLSVEIRRFAWSNNDDVCALAIFASINSFIFASNSLVSLRTSSSAKGDAEEKGGKKIWGKRERGMKKGNERVKNGESMRKLMIN